MCETAGRWTTGRWDLIALVIPGAENSLHCVIEGLLSLTVGDFDAHHVVHVWLLTAPNDLRLQLPPKLTSRKLPDQQEVVRLECTALIDTRRLLE